MNLKKLPQRILQSVIYRTREAREENVYKK